VRISAGTAQPIKHEILDHRSGLKPHVNGRLKRRRNTEQTTMVVRRFLLRSHSMRSASITSSLLRTPST